MKTIGMLGGMSWESSTVYYRLLNEEAKNRLGGLHSAKLILHSVDFGEIEPLLRAGDWDEIARRLATAAASLESSGADCLVIATNTMHKVADVIKTAISIPLINIVDVVAEAALSKGMRRLGLLGTRFTMEEPFYSEGLEVHGLKVVTPSEKDRLLANKIIFEELCMGRFEYPARHEFLRIMDDLAERGAQGVILGCTELPMLIKQSDTRLPLLDTAELHVTAAADFAM